MLKCYWWCESGTHTSLGMLTCHLLLHWPPTLPGRCSHLGQKAGVCTAKGSCYFVIILHFPESWWVLSSDGDATTLPVVVEIIFVKESGHSQGYPKERGTQPRMTANFPAFQHLQMISLHPPILWDLLRFMVFSSQRLGLNLTSVHQFFIFLLRKVLT